MNAAVYAVSPMSLLMTVLTIVLYTAVGIGLFLLGRWLTKKKPRTPGLVKFLCFACGVALVTYAFFDLGSLVLTMGSLLI